MWPRLADAVAPGADVPPGTHAKSVLPASDLTPNFDQAPSVKQFCAGTQPGEGRVEACMKAHIADVSDACKVAMANEAASED